MLRYVLISFLIADLFFDVCGCPPQDFTKLGVDIVKQSTEKFDRAGEQHIAVLGGSDIKDVEVIKISYEGVVSNSSCHLPKFGIRNFGVLFRVKNAAISNNMICGGWTYNAINQCQELNPGSLKWEERSPMKKIRYEHAMTTGNNQTRYVCGGYDESITELSSCEKMDGEWSFIKDLPTPLTHHCMIGTEDSIYAIGGDDRSESNKMYRYDIRNDEWEDTNRPMRVTRSWHSCLLIDKEILVVGGYLEKTTEIFNLQNRTWRSGPDLPKEIYSSQLVKAEPSSKYAAFLIGGKEDEDTISDIIAVTKDFKSFIKIGELKTARHSHLAMMLSDELVEKCVD